MNDRAPKTMMSPGPSRGRSPVFFIVLFLVGILGIAGGAIVVLYFVVGRDNTTSPIAALDAAQAAKPSVSTAAPTASDTPDASSPHVLATHAAVAHTALALIDGGKSTGATRGVGCLCHPNTAPTSSLCSKEQLGPSLCSCNAVVGSTTLCPVPWTAGGCPTAGTFGKTLTAKDGDPCTGYNGGTKQDGSFTNEKLDGRLASCSPCVDVYGFQGKIGSPCVGYRNERVPVAGTVDCTNLEFDCNRSGIQSACTELATHK
jgi:hypothetical protein